MKGLIITETEMRIATDVELINASLERLFFEELDCMIGALDKGSRILDYFYEGALSKNVLGILQEMKTLVEGWEPRIGLDAVAADMIQNTTDSAGIVLYCKWHFLTNQSAQNEFLVTKIYTI